MLLSNISIEKATEKVYIMMEARLSALFKSGEEYEIVERFKGEVLKGKTYLPLFPYFASVTIKFRK
jgi:isoleucyl-tRNA synthetase